MNTLSKICFPILFLLIGCDNEPESDLITWQNNYNKWQSNNMVSYEFNFRASCFCIDEWVREVRVSVNNDTIKSVLFADDNLPPQKLVPEQWHTINALFDLSKTAVEEAHQFEIKYDNAYGNPSEISIDWNLQTADDEVTFYITNMKKN
ncbi:MAG: hypothetical protein HOA15_02890 [Candidatus Marinimicrobia bacterium]|nr:hypothetical protein [Candidatus Neomarinimicrobiota bacterium]MBT3675978.1 hypothetical protein [Candidatus Neomarinimicrobiota bacterium]MBT3764119.1 hypothetical protein [Candidatus Neomarinimicrobiota bacterium]MBT4069310.1 hypothetical protein [Candidatus Neomarinimicrobiota bacterium]MBT4270468.1 hypothetical protein [Candidatus Neomarinimicrobiota bacterium]